MILDAKSTDEIAAALNVSRKTVANYHYGIKSKLGVASDIELLYVGLRQGLVGPVAPVDASRKPSRRRLRRGAMRGVSTPIFVFPAKAEDPGETERPATPGPPLSRGKSDFEDWPAPTQAAKTASLFLRGQFARGESGNAPFLPLPQKSNLRFGSA